MAASFTRAGVHKPAADLKYQLAATPAELRQTNQTLWYQRVTLFSGDILLLTQKMYLNYTCIFIISL